MTSIYIDQTESSACWSEESNIHPHIVQHRQQHSQQQQQQQQCLYQENLDLQSNSDVKPGSKFTMSSCNFSSKIPSTSPSSSASSSSSSNISHYSVIRDADSTVIDTPNENGKRFCRSLQNYFIARNRNFSSEGNRSNNGALRPHSTPATLLWLEENYEIADGVCIPRSTLYMHYVDFCSRNSIQPVNAASFGKIIRQQFPQLTTRRLGTRGQSRYHYYGIAVKETSCYYQLSYSRKASNTSDIEKIKSECNQKYQANPTNQYQHINRNRFNSTLPEFPNIKELKLPRSLDPLKTSTFLMMYRTHCQRILDTVIRANFDEVQTFVLYFWQGVPLHLSSILSSNAFINLIGVCDTLLYKSIAAVLLPSAIQTLPERLTKIMKKFASELDTWVKIALFNVPENLREMKTELARRFGQILRRQTSLSHLSQASRMVINNTDLILQMLHDWKQIDIELMCQEAISNIDQINYDESNYNFVLSICRNFQGLLEDDSNIETYLEWLDSLVRTYIVHSPIREKTSVRQLAKQFFYIWSSLGTRIFRDITLQNSASFGSFHLLRLLFDDYILYLIEYIYLEEQTKDFLDNVAKDLSPKLDFAFIDDFSTQDSILTNSCEYNKLENTVNSNEAIDQYNSNNDANSANNFNVIEQNEQIFHSQANESPGYSIYTAEQYHSSHK